MLTNDGGSAFPQTITAENGSRLFPHNFGLSGMSLRDYFAGQALVGWFSVLRPETIDEYEGEDAAFAGHQAAVAKTCYGYADAMIKAKEESDA